MRNISATPSAILTEGLCGFIQSLLISVEIELRLGYKFCFQNPLKLVFHSNLPRVLKARDVKIAGTSTRFDNTRDVSGFGGLEVACWPLEGK